MALGESATSLDGLRLPDHLGKRDYTDFDQTNAYLYDESRDDDDSPDPRKPGRKKDPNEPETKRRAQNRAAQRAFRERKERHLKDLETRVHELEQSARSWQNSNLMLRTKLSALEDELEHYRAGQVPPSGFDKSVPPVVPQSNTWPATSLDFDPLGDLQGPASVLPARNPSITGLHGPATVLPWFAGSKEFEAQLWNNPVGAPASLSGLNPPSSTLSSISTPRSVISDFGGHVEPALDPLMMGQAPPLVDLTTSSASSASSDQSPWEGNKFCEQLQKAACPLPKLPMASATPQIVPLTGDWEQQNPLELSFGYREPTPQDGVQSNFADLLGNDYGFFDPLDDPLKPLDDSLKPVDNSLKSLGPLDPSHSNQLPLSVPSEFTSPVYREPALYPLGLTPSSTSAPSEFVKEEMPSPNETVAFQTPKDGGDEVPAKSKKYMTCQAVWDRICSHPNFEGINLDELCSEFQAKARCSDSGVVLTEEDVDSVLKSVPRRPELA